MSPINEYIAYVQLLDDAYRHWTGESLPAPQALTGLERLHWLEFIASKLAPTKA